MYHQEVVLAPAAPKPADPFQRVTRTLMTTRYLIILIYSLSYVIVLSYKY